MKDYKRLMQFCSDLGLQVVGVNGEGHTIYGDPRNPQHKFTDKSPHNKYLDPTYCSRAKKVAADIKDNQPLRAKFIAAPLMYMTTYTFPVVHRVFRAGYHGIFVPDGSWHVVMLHLQVVKAMPWYK